MSYIAFIAGLPDISVDDKKLSMTLKGFNEAAADYLTLKDRRMLDLLLMTEDNKQVIRLLEKQEPDTTLDTIFPLATLQAEVEGVEVSVLPRYLQNFISDFKSGKIKEELLAENVLAESYYGALKSCGNKFIADYANFSMNMKNLVAALNCRKFGKSVADEIIGDGAFAAELKNSQLKDFGLADENEWVAQVVSLMASPNLVEREKGLDCVMWNYLDEALTFKYFSVEILIAYVLKLKSLERWSKMDTESGRKVFSELVDKFRKSLKFGDQFE